MPESAQQNYGFLLFFLEDHLPDDYTNKTFIKLTGICVQKSCFVMEFLHVALLVCY